MTNLPKECVKALAHHLPRTEKLELIHADMEAFTAFVTSGGKTRLPRGNPRQNIENLCAKVRDLLETPVGFDLLLLILPVLIEISKGGDTPPDESQLALV